MGRTTTTKYALTFRSYGNGLFNTPMCWNAKNWGRPTEKNLKLWVEKYNQSLLPGGCNAHLGTKSTIMKAYIRYNYQMGPVVASYNGPLFQVI